MRIFIIGLPLKQRLGRSLLHRSLVLSRQSPAPQLSPSATVPFHDCPLPRLLSPSMTVSFFGIEPAILDSITGKALDAEGVLVPKTLWPSITRTVYKNCKHYLNTYMNVFSALLTLFRTNFVTNTPFVHSGSLSQEG